MRVPDVRRLLGRTRSRVTTRPMGSMLRVSPRAQRVDVPSSRVVLNIRASRGTRQGCFRYPGVIKGGVSLSGLRLFMIFRGTNNVARRFESQCRIASIRDARSKCVAFS